MINDNTHRLHIPDGEVRELASPQGLLWERAVRELKSRLESAHVTRNNGIKGLKAFGGTPVKHKADKLWSRFVPAIASDTTTYPMVLKNQFDGNTNIVFGKYISAATGEFGDNAQNFYCEDYFEIKPNTSYVYWGERKSDGYISRYNRIHFYDATKTFISSSTYLIGQKSVIVSPANAKYARISCNVLDNSSQPCDAAQVALFNWYFGEGTATTEYIPYGEWKFVKDIGTNGTGTDFGYYNEATNEFVKAAGASGSVIQPIAYAESTGTQYVDTGYKVDYATAIKTRIESEMLISSTSGYRLDGIGGAMRQFYYGISLSNKTAYGDGNSDRTASAILNINTWYKFDYNPKDGYIKVYDGNGTLVSSVNFTFDSSSTVNDNVYLFCYINGSPTAPWKGKRKSTKIWNDGVLVRDFIPVRIGTSVELLDLVNWQFATRVGTFTAGADIPYTQIVPDIIKVNTGDIQYGQYGKNLFDENAVSRGYRDDNGVLQPSTASTISEYIDCEPNTTYTIKTTALQGGGYLRVHQFNSDKTWISMLAKGVAGAGTETFTFTTSSTAKYLTVSGYITGTYGKETQLEQGSQATPYEPYAKTIRTNGTHKVIVGSQGVVDLGSLSWSYSGTRFQSSTLIDAKAAGGCFTIVYSYGSGGAEKTIFIGNNRIVYVVDSSYTDAASFKAAMSGVMLYYQRSTDASFVAPQIRDIPMLFSTDSNLDVQSGVKTEAWGVKVLTGTETITLVSGHFNINGFNDRELGSTVNIIGTHVERFYKGSTYVVGIYTNDVGVETVEEFKAWLASEYAKGTPVIILYPLATPVTEQVTIAPVTSQRRTTYVADSDSELGKLNLSMEYLGKYGIPLNFITSDNKNFITSDNRQFKVQL